MQELIEDLKKIDLGRLALVALSALVYSLGMNTFVKSGNLFPGGYAGISRLLSMVAQDMLSIHVGFSTIYFAMNIATTLFVWKRIGRHFVEYSVAWFSLASLLTAILPKYMVTQDILLVAIFGGIVNGTAVGIALRANASSGGTDFIAVDLSNRLHRSSWNYIFACNVCVLLVAGFCYGWNQALYSIIFQYASTQVVNTLHQRYKVTRLQIVTDKPDEICAELFRICRHGITRLECRGAYSGKDHAMLLMSVNNNQVKSILKKIQEIDGKAFISLNPVDRIIGNYYQEPLD